MHFSSGTEDDIDTKITNNFNFDTAKSVQKKEARIEINTLSSGKDFGEGAYKMSAIKKMKATDAFLNMLMMDKKCQVEPFEECRTQALLRECNCVPFEILPIKVIFSCPPGDPRVVAQKVAI